MKKTLSLILLTAILLASCNYPSSPATPHNPSVATAVKLTLAALPTLTTIPSLKTPQAVTLVPTTTPVPATATPVMSTTPSAEDPKANLGKPTFRDTLDNGKGFGLSGDGYKDDNMLIKVADGVMTLTSIHSNAFRGWRLTAPTPQNFYLEAIFHVQTCSGKDQYGLVFRAPNYTDGYGYYYGVSCDGFFFLSRWDSNGKAFLSDWSTAPSLLQGSNKVNVLGVYAKDNTLSLYANGKKIQEFKDDGLKGAGHFGPFLASLQTSNFTVLMDEISYWNLP